MVFPAAQDITLNYHRTHMHYIEPSQYRKIADIANSRMVEFPCCYCPKLHNVAVNIDDLSASRRKI